MLQGQARGNMESLMSKKPTAIATVDDYFARLPVPARSALSQMRDVIRSVVPPDSTEVISYQMPAFKRDRILVWYAAFANHVSLFPGGSVLATFGDVLTRFKTSKGTIQFPLDRPIPVALIKRIVKARVASAASLKGRRASKARTAKGA
jgi:uncharacterized protein YdhG (YjbR/CyaY superfamily)